jgi:hypothetical protein
VVPDGDSLAYGVFREDRAERPGEESPSWAGGDLWVLELRFRRGRWLVSPRADLVPEVGQVEVGNCRD